jgi:preprotein translocase subunit SecE
MNREAKRAQRREERKADEQAADAVPAGSLERTERERSTPAQFLREVRNELKKVAWPNRQEVISYTLVVLATTTVLTAYVFGLDWVIRNALINVFE